MSQTQNVQAETQPERLINEGGETAPPSQDTKLISKHQDLTWEYLGFAT